MDVHGDMPFGMTKKVQLYHTGGAQLATVTALLRFAQEGAGRHAEELGFGLAQLGEKKRAWVLREQAMNVFRFPSLDEEVLVRTWPTYAERILCHRDFLIADAQGGILARGTSAWFGLDLETRRPCKAESMGRFGWDTSAMPLFENPPGDVETPGDCGECALRTVRPSDLDALGHMNNLRYLDWVRDYMSLSGLDETRLRGVRIRHVREVTSGGHVRLMHRVDAGGDVLIGMKSEEGKDVCLARISMSAGGAA